MSRPQGIMVNVKDDNSVGVDQDQASCSPLSCIPNHATPQPCYSPTMLLLPNHGTPQPCYSPTMLLSFKTLVKGLHPHCEEREICLPCLFFFFFFFFCFFFSSLSYRTSLSLLLLLLWGFFCLLIFLFCFVLFLAVYIRCFILHRVIHAKVGWAWANVHMYRTEQSGSLRGLTCLGAKRDTGRRGIFFFFFFFF